MKKKMKKSLIALILFTFIILCGMMYSNNAVAADSPTGLDSIFTNANSENSGNGRINLQAYQDNSFWFSFSGINPRTRTWDNAILNQGNIFCIQRGVYTASNYSVSGEYTVQSPYLSYILKDVKVDDKTGNYAMDPTQNAVWDYLLRIKNTPEDKRTDEEKADYANLGVGSLKEAQSNININDLMNKAWLYSNKYYNIYTNDAEKPNIALSMNNDNTFNISISGAYNEVTEITVDGATINENVGTFTDGSNSATVSVTAKYGPIYTVKYRVLKSNNGQRLIVVTDITVTDMYKTATATIQKPSNIPEEGTASLQKFIIGKYSSINSETDFSSVNLENNDIVSKVVTVDNIEKMDMTQRYNKIATDTTFNNDNNVLEIHNGTAINDNTTIKARQNWKYSNPVKISKGNFVTYEIAIYNNGYNQDSSISKGISNLEFVDYLTTDYNLSNINRLSIDDKRNSLEAISNSEVSVVDIRAYSSNSYGLSNPTVFDKYQATINSGEIEFSNVNISNSQAAVKFLITIRFNKAYNCIIGNYAKLLSHTNNNYRRQDVDFIEMRKFIITKIYYRSK